MYFASGLDGPYLLCAASNWYTALEGIGSWGIDGTQYYLNCDYCRYPLYGGMQDWNYLHGDCLELTLEMNEDKWPPPSKVLSDTQLTWVWYGLNWRIWCMILSCDPFSYAEYSLKRGWFILRVVNNALLFWRFSLQKDDFGCLLIWQVAKIWDEHRKSMLELVAAMALVSYIFNWSV